MGRVDSLWCAPRSITPSSSAFNASCHPGSLHSKTSLLWKREDRHIPVGTAMSQLTQQKGSRPQAPSEAANTAVKISGPLDMEDSSGWACHGPQLPSPAGRARCSPFSSSARDCGGSLLCLCCHNVCHPVSVQWTQEASGRAPHLCHRVPLDTPWKHTLRVT